MKKNKQKGAELSRRSFLKGLAVLAGSSLMLPGCSRDDVEDLWDSDSDDESGSSILPANSKHISTSKRVPLEPNNPSIDRNDRKCERCGDCSEVCERDVTVLGTYSLANTKDVAVCVHCGACIKECEKDAMFEKYSYNEVFAALNDPNKIVIASTAPAVRVALGEEFGMPVGSFVEGKMVASLRALGFDYVLDNTFSADLTIMEEASELVERIVNKSAPLPQFTSCCPAWVKFAEIYFPQYLSHLSSARSPFIMQGAMVKSLFAKEKGIDPSRIVHVAVAPCTAKKYEITRPEHVVAGSETGAGQLRSTDYTITTRELAMMLKSKGIGFGALPNASFDSLFGRGSGAGVIFGNTGGVMQAAIRTAYFKITGQVPPADLIKLTAVRGLAGIREASVNIGGTTLKVAVINGLKNARRLLSAMNPSNPPYHFVEVMSCVGGCIAGAGQPRKEEIKTEDLQRRITSLYTNDEQSAIRFSHDNPEIKYVYQNYLGAPLSPKSEILLHTEYSSKANLLG